MINDFVGKLIADKYRIESLVRESDSGDIYIGRHDISGNALTLQILPQAFAVDVRWAKRFLDQARSASALHHDNILNITDFGTDSKGVVYAVYEPFSGTTLKSLLATDSPLDQSRALDIAKQVAAATVAAHAKKAVHGTIDPNNIFVESEPGKDVVKVLGFGSDNLLVARDADPRYLAPEQLTSFPVADERSDVYSLGVILYEMLAGEVPFGGRTPAEVLANQTSEPPTPISTLRTDLHPQIEPIILSAISRDAENRYPHMSDLAEDLDRVSGELGTKTAAATASGNNLWQTAFIVLAGIVLLGGALIYFTLGKKTDPTTALVGDANSMPVQPINPATGIQEETLAKMIGDADSSLMENANGAIPPGTIPGGDGYDPWANGGRPPVGAPPLGSAPAIGAPPMTYTQPGGQVVTIDPNSPSQFMPNEGGIILVPIPANNDPVDKPDTTPKAPAGNTATQPLAQPTPKQMATPLPKSGKATAKPKATAGDKSPATPVVKPNE